MQDDFNAMEESLRSTLHEIEVYKSGLKAVKHDSNAEQIQSHRIKAVALQVRLAALAALEAQKCELEAQISVLVFLLAAC